MALSPDLIANTTTGLIAGVAAWFAHRTHRELRTPSDQTAAELLADMSHTVGEIKIGQQELSTVVTSHIADDEKFQTAVTQVVRLPTTKPPRRRN